jgi:catechol 2,3-dioxygenase-like lactoylglutathione lyase family enzyme
MTDPILRFPQWIGVVCSDLEAQRRFYCDTLGLREVASGDDWLQLDLGNGVTFELLARSSAPQYDRPRYQVGFAVDNIAAVRDQLMARGVEAITDVIESSDSASRWAYFRDPEGNVFEITERDSSST